MIRRSVTLVAMLAMLNTVSLSVFAGDKKDPKKDPDSIGDRNVGEGINFYSLEREIALGKQLAQEVERQAKVIDDPDHRGIREPRRAEPGPELRRQGAVHY